MVYIKEIHMIGFKSYGNDLVTMPLSKGFTCIIGPNGSGKSNAIDAINFCLGTLSMKDLRGKRMTDVMYSGIGGQKPAEKTSVEIVFDNSDYSIPVKEEVVTVSREMKRSGSSVYRFNRKRTTRQEILDKLRIAGIDCINGYNIIQQGKVAEIVGMSTIQRRELIENISGVGEFDDKKQAAIVELDEAQTKMGELQLLISEVSTRLEELRKEKEAAEKWLHYSEQIKSSRTLLVSWRLIESKKSVNVLNDQIKEINSSIDELAGTRDTQVEEDIQNTMERLRNVQEQIGVLERLLEQRNKELNQLKIDEAKIAQNIKFSIKTEEEKKNRANKTDEELNVLKVKVDKEKQAIEVFEKNRVEIEERLAVIRSEKEELELLIESKENEYERVKDYFDEISSRHRAETDRLTKLEITIDMAGGMIESLNKNIDRKTSQIEETKKQLSINRNRIEALQKEIDNQTTLLETSKGKLEISIKRIGFFDKQLEKAEEEARKYEDELIVIETKTSTIKSFVKSADEKDKVNPAVNSILKEAKTGNLKGIVGELANSIEKQILPKEIANLADAIITVDLKSTIDCINFLKDKAVGVANFIPLDQLGLRTEHVGKKLVAKMRERSSLVDDVEEAAEVWMKSKNSVVMTADGDQFLPNGVIFGGFHIASAAESLEKLEEDYKLKTNLAKEAKGNVNELKLKRKRVMSLNKAVEKSRKTVEERVRTAIVELQHSKQNKRQLKDILQRYEEERSPLTVQLAEKQQQEETCKHEIEEKERKLKRIKEEFSEAEIELEKADVRPLLNELNEKEKVLSKASNALSKIEAKNEATKNAVEERLTRIQLLKEQLQVLKVEVSAIQGARETHEQQLEEMKEKRESAMAEKDSTLTDMREKTREASGLRHELSALQKENERINGKIVHLREDINELKVKRERADAQVGAVIKEATESELELLPESEISDQEVNERVLESKINKMTDERKKLEPVNMRSIEEYSEVEKRYNSLTVRRDILHEERQVIVDFIAQLETEKTNIFFKTFNAINREFGKIFKELSEGSAQMILENPESVFEGGLIMEAQPAGKKVKSLQSMSGGEKALTALAFIFSVQQVDAQPFYVLDEIDAALDVMNVDRVGRLLYKLSRPETESSAQFLVISHRDILMSKADVLYGCSNVKGISQMSVLELGAKGLARRK